MPVGRAHNAATDEVKVGHKVVASRSQRYEVRFVEPLLDVRADDLLIGGAVPGRRFAVVDDGVPASWMADFASYFAARNVEVGTLVLRGGEEFKTMDAVLMVIQEFEHFGLDRRNEPVIIVGGGAVLDTVGLAAALYRRGVPYIRVPSTLLAYVDVSIGIKTGVNFGGVKNLVGAFAPPTLVLLDRTLLRSLPPREIASGLGEIIKIALGCDGELFGALEEFAENLVGSHFCDDEGQSILSWAIDVMIRELEPNIYEDDLARAVDLGHTFSQPFELMGGRDRLRHGEAVAIDVNLSAVIAHRRGMLAADQLERLQILTRRLGLPLLPPAIAPELLWMSLVERTRHRGGRQRLPVPFRIGACTFLDDVTADEVRAAVDVLAAYPA